MQIMVCISGFLINEDEAREMEPPIAVKQWEISHVG